MSSALVSRDALGGWRQVRRYAVPPAMIAEATAARLDGDWRAACRAAAVEVAGDAETFAPFADDLRHLAPDLVRWHLPRSPSRGDTTIEPRRLIVLATRGDAVLGIATPRTGPGTQRLLLFAGRPDERPRFHGRADWSDRRELWDARHTGELLTRACGPRTAEVLALQDAGRTAEAWSLAGVALPDPAGDDWSTRYLPEAFTTLDVDPVRVLEAARASGLTNPAVVVGYYHELRLYDLDSPHPRGEWVRRERNAVDRLPIEPLRRPVDLHLVRLGLLSPADLHPLVAPLLAPFATPSASAAVAASAAAASAVAASAATPSTATPSAVAASTATPSAVAASTVVPSAVVAASTPSDISEMSGTTGQRAGAGRGGPLLEGVRLRCGGEWHLVRWEGGRLSMPHSDEERRREQALRALGGEVHGCFAAAAAWRDRSARLPRRLEGQRRDLMLRGVHGDLDGVLALLDAGIDPHARDPHGRTLLHLLPSLDHRTEGVRALLARLLAAGLDVEDRDNRGRTPLHTAVHGDGSADLVRALLDAGASLDAEDFVGDTIADAYERHREEDLPWLAAMLP